VGPPDSQRQLGRWAITFLVYFNVSGGPFGAEDLVSACGPLPGLIGCVVFMLLWATPVSLVTAELSTAFPEDGGYSIWVSEAFGEFWGFMESYLSWGSGVVDNALYPVLAYQTAVRIFGGMWGDPLPSEDSNADLTSWKSYACKVVLTFIFSIPNFLSASAFERGLGLAFGFVVLPFAVFSILSILFARGGKWSNLLIVRENATSSDVGTLLTTLYWNFSGFDCVSTCAGEVRDPQRSFPQGLAMAIFFVTLSYSVPLSAAIANGTPSWSKWDAGWWSTVGLEQVGSWMGSWIVLAAFVSSFGQHVAELFEDSWQLAGMADTGMLPAIFSKRHPLLGSPWVAVLFQLCLILLLVSFDFTSILVVSSCLSVLSTLLELSAFAKLRASRPELERPFAVPVQSRAGLALFLFFPFVIGSVSFVSCFVGGGFMLPVVNSLGLLGGPLSYIALRRCTGARYHHGAVR